MEIQLQLLTDNAIIAIIISLIINISIAVAGLIPSTFLTAANILYFGFEMGLFISIVGEAMGAIISFYLYKYGIQEIEKKFSRTSNKNNKWLTRLKNAQGKEAVLLVVALRIFPFVPSGLVTLTASLSKMKGVHFVIASTIGKIPALFIEAYSIQTVLTWKIQYQIGATIVGLCIVVFYYVWTKRKKV